MKQLLWFKEVRLTKRSFLKNKKPKSTEYVFGASF